MDRTTSITDAAGLVLTPQFIVTILAPASQSPHPLSWRKIPINYSLFQVPFNLFAYFMTIPSAIRARLTRPFPSERISSRARYIPTAPLMWGKTVWVVDSEAYIVHPDSSTKVDMRQQQARNGFPKLSIH